MKPTDKGPYRHSYVFETTGRCIPAVDYILGIGPAADTLYEGRDGNALLPWDEELTMEERAEVADYMIDLWQKFKAGTNQ